MDRKALEPVHFQGEMACRFCRFFKYFSRVGREKIDIGFFDENGALLREPPGGEEGLFPYPRGLPQVGWMVVSSSDGGWVGIDGREVCCLRPPPQ